MTLAKLLKDLPLCYAPGSVFAKVVAEVEALAASDVSIYFRGESGTGKTRLAWEVHRWSPRHLKRFIRWNPAEAGKGLVASDLGGHRRGAFSSADRDRAGILIFCSGGTVLLDEFDRFDRATVGFLMSFLDSQSVRPVGSDEPVPVDVRLLLASNRDVERMADEGRFAPELWWRFSPAIVDVPPLRERREDIPLLARQLTHAVARDLFGIAVELEAGAVDALAERSWPGNLRQLAGAIQTLIQRCRREGRITASDVARVVSRPAAAARPPKSPREEQLRAALVKTGSAAGAAKLLEVSERTVHREAKRYGLEGLLPGRGVRRPVQDRR